MLAVSESGTGRDRGIPDFRASWIGGHGPAIVLLQTISGLYPGGARIPTHRDASTRATAFVDPVSIAGMEGERVAIAQCAPAMFCPGLPAILAAYHGPKLNANHDGPGIGRRKRNRLHVGSIGFLCR